MFTISHPSPCAAKIAHNSLPKMKLYRTYNISRGMHLHYHKASFNRKDSTRTAHTAVACTADDSGPREEAHSALETVLKLYEAIKNKNIQELSDIIAEECLCVSNFVFAFQPFLGKKQVLAFFSSLIKNLGNNVQFVVERTSDDGMVVGVSWKLEWDEVRLPLGKGFSIYMCHVYGGKVKIKNVEIFLEPILHIEPLRMKLISLAMTAMEKINPQSLFKNKARTAAVMLFILLIIAAIVFLFKYRVPV